MFDKEYFIDIDFYQLSKHGQNTFGDVFVTKKIRDENRLISVLSDGLGSGIKANVLATLTSTMAVEFITKEIDILDAASIIMKTLPVCKERKISYSTFTIVDIHDDLLTRIIEYDNPRYIKLNQDRVEQINKETRLVNQKNKRKNYIRSSQFTARPGDRIIFFSDGVSQSGMGSRQHPLGWKEEDVEKYALSIISSQPDISSRELARKIVNQSRIHDQNQPKDDISCGVIYFREPRSLLIVTGPPIDQRNDPYITKRLKNFEGKKVICGGTTANIIARESGAQITTSIDDSNPHLPPFASMEGIDLITEGVITFTKVEELLKSQNFMAPVNDNGAMKLINMLLNSDFIQFIVGTRINEAHHDLHMPVELEIRRNIVKKIITLLEEKYFKETVITFI